MPSGIPRWLKRVTLVALAAAMWLALQGGPSADTILFTASTDNSGGVNPVSVPGTNNPFIPTISPGVTYAPALLNGQSVGPLNGVKYGPDAFGGNTGGTTGFVNVAFTLTQGGSFRLVWEVSDVIDHSRASALATDNVRLNNTPLFSFDSGLPSGFTALGSVGTSSGVAGLAPTGGNSFAYLDTKGNVAPIYDTVDGTFGSRLYSPTFLGAKGDTFSLDAAFLTNDGGPFHDYGIIVLQAVPEPSTLVLTGLSTALSLAGYRWLRRKKAGPLG